MVDIELGVIVHLREGPAEAIRKVRELGFPTCQIQCWDESLLKDEVAEELCIAAAKNQVKVTTIWTGLPGRHVWNLVEGPTTIGIVPEWRRERRLAVLKKGSDFAGKVGVSSITTHVGFIPENPADRLYSGLIDALTEIAAYCRTNGQSFWFETGQETPVTLLRTIEDVGYNNLGINFDPANLLMYGKANPIDALDLIGSYVRGVHAKDGAYPQDGRSLGDEKPLGQGRVDFTAMVAKLRSLGFSGALTIEREISGSEQIRDIQQGKVFLEQILASV